LSAGDHEPSRPNPDFKDARVLSELDEPANAPEEDIELSLTLFETDRLVEVDLGALEAAVRIGVLDVVMVLTMIAGNRSTDRA